MADLVILLVALAPMAIWRGYVLSVLWGWFVQPVFGLPALGLIEAIGLTVLISMLVPSNPDKDESAEHAIGMAAIVPLLALCYGALWHAFA